MIEDIETGRSKRKHLGHKIRKNDKYSRLQSKGRLRGNQPRGRRKLKMIINGFGEREKKHEICDRSRNIVLSRVAAAIFR